MKSINKKSTLGLLAVSLSSMAVSFGAFWHIKLRPIKHKLANEYVMSVVEKMNVLSRLEKGNVPGAKSVLFGQIEGCLSALDDDYSDSPGMAKIVGKVAILYDEHHKSPPPAIKVMIRKYANQPGFNEPGLPDLYD